MTREFWAYGQVSATETTVVSVDPSDLFLMLNKNETEATYNIK